MTQWLLFLSRNYLFFSWRSFWLCCTNFFLFFSSSNGLRPRCFSYMMAGSNAFFLDFPPHLATSCFNSLSYFFANRFLFLMPFSFENFYHFVNGFFSGTRWLLGNKIEAYGNLICNFEASKSCICSSSGNDSNAVIYNFLALTAVSNAK